MLDCFAASDAQAVPVIPVTSEGFGAWLAEQAADRRRWIEAVHFQAKPHTLCLLPGADGTLDAALVGVGTERDFWALADLPGKLPPGVWRLQSNWTAEEIRRAAVGWGLGAYRYERYRKWDRPLPKLVLNKAADAVEAQVRAIYRVRDLINTPAEDMMPEDLAEAAEQLAQDFGARLRQIVGDDLIEQNYPAIHAVGRASVHAPRLLDLTWGRPADPKLTLVGKGVCFDTGGLDIKPPSAMRLMKKDMGGAAHALGLAQLVMSARLPVRLRVLIPAVDNAISGSAFRPGDVLSSRSGKRIEIDNTDAEGRLVLCDALTEAASEQPQALIDFATLTGAARVALGSEVPAFFTTSEDLAATLEQAGREADDPIWRLPLHRPYREQLDSDVADIVNASSESYGGAVTAALFLQEFVPPDLVWLHFDLMGWNLRKRPGRPKGGEAMGLRAAFDYLQNRFGGEGP